MLHHEMNQKQPFLEAITRVGEHIAARRFSEARRLNPAALVQRPAEN
jgi:hypothetical protein